MESMDAQVRTFTPGLLDGIRHTEKVKYEHPEAGPLEVEIRPLRHSECKRVRRLVTGSVRLTGTQVDMEGGEPSLEMDAGALVEGRYSAQLTACGLGTTDARWTEATIDAEWPTDMVVLVGDRIMEISGISGDKQSGKGTKP